jgi:hypothetical protein
LKKKITIAEMTRDHHNEEDEAAQREGELAASSVWYAEMREIVGMLVCAGLVILFMALSKLPLMIYCASREISVFRLLFGEDPVSCEMLRTNPYDTGLLFGPSIPGL